MCAQTLPATWSMDTHGEVFVHSCAGSSHWKQVAHKPVYVSLAEAMAYCTSRRDGSRIMTESEYQRAVDADEGERCAEDQLLDQQWEMRPKVFFSHRSLWCLRCTGCSHCTTAAGSGAPLSLRPSQDSPRSPATPSTVPTSLMGSTSCSRCACRLPHFPFPCPQGLESWVSRGVVRGVSLHAIDGNCVLFVRGMLKP
jgi:hypothetical protein